MPFSLSNAGGKEAKKTMNRKLFQEKSFELGRRIRFSWSAGLYSSLDSEMIQTKARGVFRYACHSSTRALCVGAKPSGSRQLQYNKRAMIRQNYKNKCRKLQTSAVSGGLFSSAGKIGLNKGTDTFPCFVSTGGENICGCSCC